MKIVQEMITKPTTALFLLLLLAILPGCTNKGQEQAKMDTTQLRDQAQPLDSPAMAAAAPGFIHTVFFWLREDLTAEERAAFLRDLNKLRAIETIRTAYVGQPAGTPREVVDNTYDYAWIVHFDDRAGQDVYQEHPVHLEFVELQQKAWTRVQVYDTVIE